MSDLKWFQSWKEVEGFFKDGPLKVAAKTVLTQHEFKTKYGPIPVVCDPTMAKGTFMFGGLPFNYEGIDNDDDGDVADIAKLKAQIEQQQKTIDRLVKLQTINPEKTVFVLKIPATEGWGQENHDAFVKLLPSNTTLIAMPADYSLEGLDDRDLQELGLRRATGPALSESQAYDAMLMGYRPR